jgi:hypothetical protein
MILSKLDSELAKIPDVKRIEHCSKENFRAHLMNLSHSVYPHDEIYGSYCSVETYIDCPPEKVFEYMSKSQSLNEWTYSVRDLLPTSEDKNLFKGYDIAGGKDTLLYCKTVSNREAMTVDYHCSWDQGEKLWMIYLNRIIPAQLVLNKPGSVVLWTNCRHPFYNENPFPETAPKGRLWVGDLWDWFAPGHKAEIQNLKAIIEYRYKNNLPMDAGLL